MRYVLDGTWTRTGAQRTTVLAGSPFRIFRLTDAGASVVDKIERGDDVTSRLADRLADAGAIHPTPEAPTRFTAADLTIVTPQLGGVVVFDGRITVDDASTPPLSGATVRLESNRGPAAARNEGRRHVTTSLIAFVDADVDLGVDASDSQAWAAWVGPLVAHFDDPKVGLVAPRVLGDDGSSLDLGVEPARISAGTRVSYAPGATLLVRAEAFDDVGGFDERMRFGEDVDLVWRLDEAGWRCRYEPAASVDHTPRPSLIGRLRQQVGYGSSSAPLAVRHPKALAPFRSNGWTASVWGLVAFGHPIAAAGLALGSAAALIPKLPELSPSAAFQLALRGHLAAGEQLATAVRRAWWPIIAVLALCSRRARWIGLASAVVAPRRMLIDAAFGWGVWSTLWRHRTWRPIIPQLAAWPGRRR